MPRVRLVEPCLRLPCAPSCVVVARAPRSTDAHGVFRPDAAWTINLGSVKATLITCRIQKGVRPRISQGAVGAQRRTRLSTNVRGASNVSLRPRDAEEEEEEEEEEEGRRSGGGTRKGMKASTMRGSEHVSAW